MNYFIDFDTNVICIEAVKKAAYKYLVKFSADIKLGIGSLTVRVEFDQKIAENEHLAIINDFKKEVLDQDLREIIKRETEGYRNLVLAHTFSKTSLISNE